MIAIVDYGVGNLFSLKSSFKEIGYDAVVTADPQVILSADKVILPGVGAFGDASDKLFSSGLAEVVLKVAENGTPLMGICLGMQLLFDKGFEYGEHKGLGLIKGEVKSISEVIPSNLKIPHMGWNSLKFTAKSEIFKYLSDGDFVYFVHSFYGANCPFVTATADYGYPLTASVQNKNVYGCQFHPEKSGETGLKILRAFCELGE
ncbi:MAG: imidazole glycerol phosphate synthase subunit HisH [Clostridia bacterium]|nr:imidazole glycerol phosphate synthase subunit HisH [Clostridia bacterium]